MPTVAESGFEGFRSETWNGLIAPARTPDAIIQILVKEVKAALKDEKILRALENYGVDAIGSTPEEFKATIAEDIKQWAAAIQAADLKL